MVKRKREDVADGRRPSKGPLKTQHTVPKAIAPVVDKIKKSASKPKAEAAKQKHMLANADSKSTETAETPAPVSIQIITGSYEKTLHGFAATLPKQNPSASDISSTSDQAKESDLKDYASATFSDTFLFAAHSSAVRCLAISQSTESHKRVLASGSTDERINLYSVSTSPPEANAKTKLPTLSKTEIMENPRNRELGSLLHHSRSVTKLDFPTKGKLFSAAEDNTIAISRTRDWTVLSTIKAPIPKPMGRPSGDTAAPGEVPAGVNDFAIHPSMKLMVSVSKGEKSMRLWNLVTGKKAGVLNFDRQLLQQVGEGRYGSGEGRRVLWTDVGEDFVVGFERGVAVFGIDSKPKAVIKPHPPTKIHQMRFLPASSDKRLGSILAVSTENGKILFYDLTATDTENDGNDNDNGQPTCPALAQLGGPDAGLPGRIKDFEILALSSTSKSKTSSSLLCVAGSSDGAVRLWMLDAESFEPGTNSTQSVADGESTTPRQIGTLVGAHETGSRITCLAAFVMDGPRGLTSAADHEDVALDVEGDESSDSDSD